MSNLITLAMVASLVPPAQYDHAPSMPYHVRDMPAAKMERLCPSPDGVTLGCSAPELGIVWVLDGLRPEVRRVIVRHELAHINGWSHRP